MELYNILIFSLPLFFCLLLSWASPPSTTTATTLPSPPPPPPSSSSSILAAAETLRTRGYSLFSSSLISTFSASLNFSGTILAAPDFLFAFSPNPSRRALPLLSTTLLLYHILSPPSLRWLDLTPLLDGHQLPTLHSDYCLFLFKNPNGDVFISSSKKPMFAVNIRQPDLYVDGNVAVHGVDGVLDPSTGDKCTSVAVSHPTAEIQWVHRSFLDHAIRRLRRRGFHVAATAMALRWPDLLSSPAVTIFVPSDKALFSKPHGFRYDFRRHVVPKRLRFNELMAYTDGAEFETLAPNKSVFVLSGDDSVSVNGVRADGGEIYHNRWIVLHSLPTTLDDAAAGEFLGFSNCLPSLPETGGKFSGEMTNYLDAGQVSNGVPTPAPESNIELIGPPSPTPAQETHFIGPIQNGVPGVPPVSDQDHVEDMISELIRPPTPSPSIGDSTNDQCGVVPGVTVRVDNADLICPVSDVLNMQENGVKTFPDVAPFQPSDGVDGTQLQLSKKLLQSEPLISEIHHTDELKIEKGRVSDKTVKQDPDLSNIAGDLFYYT